MTSITEESYTIATTTPELPLTSAVITAGARHLAESCKIANAAFSQCKADNNGNPTTCAAAGASVTECTRGFFAAMGEHCADEFAKQWECLDVNNMQFNKCRKSQSPLDVCVFTKMGLHGYFPTYDTERSPSVYAEG